MINAKQLLMLGVLISSLSFFFKGALLLAVLLLGVLLTSISLWIKSNTQGWWLWAIEIFLLFSAAILIFGAKNIVGSGQQFSSKMAVATLRVFVWAQDQCLELTSRACTMTELSGVEEHGAIKADLLKPEFKKTKVLKNGALFSTSGLYHYAIYPNPLGSDPTQWVAYAWPTQEKKMPTFCINQNEEILIHESRGGYLGENAPHANACLGAIEKIREQEKSLNWDRTRLKQEERQDSIAYPIGFIKALASQGMDGSLWGRWKGKATRREKAIYEDGE